VRKRHTWQFKQLDASTRDDHDYSDRRKAYILNTVNSGQAQVAQKSCMMKIFQYSETFQGSSCFSGQAQVAQKP